MLLYLLGLYIILFILLCIFSKIYKIENLNNNTIATGPCIAPDCNEKNDDLKEQNSINILNKQLNYNIELNNKLKKDKLQSEEYYDEIKSEYITKLNNCNNKVNMLEAEISSKADQKTQQKNLSKFKNALNSAN